MDDGWPIESQGRLESQDGHLGRNAEGQEAEARGRTNENDSQPLPLGALTPEE